MKHNSLKFSLILSIAFLLFSCFVFLFLYKQISDNKKTSEQILTEWKTESVRRNEIKSLEQSLKNVDAEKVLLETHFAQSSDIVPFLNTIESLAATVKTEVEISSVDIPKDNTGLLVGIKASGTFESVYKFLLLLENSPYEIEFISSNINRDTGKDSSVTSSPSSQWTAIFTIKLLSFIP